MFEYTNEKGTKYYLNQKTVTLRGGRETSVRYFTKDKRDTATELPEGYGVKENPRTGLPFAYKLDKESK